MLYIAERLTLLSAIARSMDDSRRSCGLWYVEREPRRHMTADLCKIHNVQKKNSSKESSPDYFRPGFKVFINMPLFLAECSNAPL